MSQTGNIKGAPGGFVPNRVSDNGSYGRGGEEKTRIGRAPVDPNAAGAGGVREEKTRIGRAPVDPGTTTAGGTPTGNTDPTRTGGTTKGGGTGIDFSQDGLVSTPSRTERPRESQSGSDFESRPTSERPRPRAQQAGGMASDFESRPTTERPQVPSRSRDAEGASSGQFGSPAESTTTDRTQTTRPRETDGAASSEFDSPQDLESPQTTDRSSPTRSAEGASDSEFDFPDEPDPADEHWAPEGSERPRSTQTPRQVDDSDEVTGEFLDGSVEEDSENPPELGEPPAQSRGPGRGRGVEGRPGGTFETPRGQDGLPRGERPAHGAGPGGPGGSPLFEPMPRGGRPSPGTGGPGGAFPGFPGGPTQGMPGSIQGGLGGKGDTASLDALFPDLSGIFGQQALAEHFQENLLLLPPRQSPAARSLRLWAMFTAYAEANARNPQGQTPAGREAFAEALTANGYAALRDARTGRDGVTVALELLEAGSPEELQAQLEQLQMEPAAEHLHSLSSETHLPVAEEPRAREQQEARKEAARQQQAQSTKVSEQKEKDAERYAAAAGPTGAKTQDAQTQALNQAGQLSQRELRQELEERRERERRGTNKKLGSNLLWGTLHSLRDSAEDTAVLREKWNQLAFGAIVALVGMGLLVAMLVSL